jgi:elongation factor Ts
MLQKIKKIRQETGAGLNDIREALEEARGNERKALAILAKRGSDKAERKKTRELKSGLIDSYVHMGKVGVLIEVQTETDFVAKNQQFKDLVHDLCLQIASADPRDIAELFKQPFIKDESMTVKELIDQAIAKIGENIDVKRFIRYSLE